MPGGTQVPSSSDPVFAYRTVTFFGGLSHTLLLTGSFVLLLLGPTTPNPQADQVWAAPISLATTLGILSFPLGTEMFQFPRFPSGTYVFSTGSRGSSSRGFPIRISPDRWLFTPPRSFSQCPTSFIGTHRPGIHHKLLVASSRDTENSVLLLHCYYFTYCCLSAYFSDYALVKEQSPFLLGFPIRLSGWVPVGRRWLLPTRRSGSPIPNQPLLLLILLLETNRPGSPPGQDLSRAILLLH